MEMWGATGRLRRCSFRMDWACSAETDSTGVVEVVVADLEMGDVNMD